MSIDGTMAVLYAQTGLAAPLANAAAVAPQAAMAMTRVIAHELAQQEASIVEKADKSQKPKVAADGNDQGKGGMPFGRRQRRRAPESPDQQTESRALSPLVGNLLNMKV